MMKKKNHLTGTENSFLCLGMLFISLLCSILQAKAETFTVGGLSYEITSSSTCRVTANDDNEISAIVIPSEVTYNQTAYKVTAIGYGVFYGCMNLSTVIFSDSIKEIGANAFGNCVSLMSLTIPDSMESIDKAAFEDTYVQELYLGDCINRIGMLAFPYVNTVHLLPTISRISFEAFEDADNLQTIYIPSSVKEIEANAFAFCGNLRSVNIDDLGNWCMIKFGNENANPTSKAGGINLNGEYLTSIIVPDEVNSINSYAFYGCNSICSLYLSDSVEEIGFKSFYQCYNLSTLYFGKGVKRIGTMAVEMNSIRNIYTNDLNAFCQIDIDRSQIFDQFYNTNLYYNDQLVTKINLDYGVEKIGNKIFDSYSKLTSVTMPSSVKALGYSSFSCCLNLIKVVLSDSITIIPLNCFSGCNNLTSIYFPERLVEIEDYAFAGVAIKNIFLPSNVAKIGEYAFQNCKADTVVLSDCVEELKAGTFSDCKNLKSIDLGRGMKKIDSSCFRYCENLESLNLPSTMEQISIFHYDDIYSGSGPNIKTIYCNNSQPYDAYFDNYTLSHATLYVPVGCKKIFMEDYRWNGFKEIIEMDGLGAVQEINGNECTTSICQEVYDLNGRFIANSTEGVTPGIYVVKKGAVHEKVLVK